MILSASINLDLIKDELLIKGKKGRYVNLTIKTFDERDHYGNDLSVEQRTEKGETKIYLGNGRILSK